MLFEVVRLLGQSETNSDTESSSLLRLLCPIMKLYTGKKCVPVISEGLECIGGQGYIEDTGVPKLLRDAQVTPIWEGTSNILSLDVLRAIAKSKGEVLLVWGENIAKRLSASLKSTPELEGSAGVILREMENLREVLTENEINERGARLLAMSLAELTIGMLLIEQAAGAIGVKSDMTAARRWALQIGNVRERFEKAQVFDEISKEESDHLVFDCYSE